MSAQAKPSFVRDSLLTASVGEGSFVVPQNTLQSPPLRAGAGLPLGLYVHVPFCATTCDFCAFYQEKPKRELIDLYLKAVAAELQQVRQEILRGDGWLWQGERLAGGVARAGVAATSMVAGAGVSAAALAPTQAGGAAQNGFTIFFGGGTPGLLAAKDLETLCRMVRDTLDPLGPILEWSIELAPSTVKADKVRVLLDHGVTRCSLGVQSFSEPLLEALGRRHSAKRALEAYATLRENGATNVNCDLMFALPGQSREQWLADLQKMHDLGPEHISTYCLTFEEDTALWVKLSQGRYKLDAEREAALYRETWEWLDAHGYRQYEVSNFAKAGYESRHNLATWQMGRWRGVGPAGASQWGGWRFQNPANIEQWAQAVLTVADGQQDDGAGATAGTGDEVWPPVQAEERTQLDNSLLAADALIFGLRKRAGVERAAWLTRFAGGQSAEVAASSSSDRGSSSGGEPSLVQVADSHSGSLPLAELERLFARLRREGLLAAGDHCWRLSVEGMLLADAVGGEVMECFVDC